MAEVSRMTFICGLLHFFCTALFLDATVTNGVPVTSIRRYFTCVYPVASAMRVVSLGHLVIALVRFCSWLHRLNPLSRRGCVVQLLPCAHACLCRLAIHWEICCVNDLLGERRSGHLAVFAAWVNYHTTC